MPAKLSALPRSATTTKVCSSRMLQTARKSRSICSRWMLCAPVSHQACPKVGPAAQHPSSTVHASRATMSLIRRVHLLPAAPALLPCALPPLPPGRASAACRNPLPRCASRGARTIGTPGWWLRRGASPGSGSCRHGAEPASFRAALRRPIPPAASGRDAPTACSDSRRGPVTAESRHAPVRSPASKRRAARALPGRLARRGRLRSRFWRRR